MRARAGALADQRALAAGAPLGQETEPQVRWLCEVMALSPRMRVLDLGCGGSTSSRFLARLGLNVAAVDRDTLPARGVGVFPLRADAVALPFPRNTFDAAIAIGSWHYIGTDERYLPELLGYLRPGGLVGIVDIGFRREIGSAEEAPEFLAPTFAEHWSFVHAPGTWGERWRRTGLVDLVACEPMPGSDRLLADYARRRAAAGAPDEISRAVPLDREGTLTLFRLVARKR